MEDFLLKLQMEELHGQLWTQVILVVIVAGSILFISLIKIMEFALATLHLLLLQSNLVFTTQQMAEQIGLPLLPYQLLLLQVLMKHQ